MAGLTGQPVRTFTIGFDDNDGFDERPYARLVADRFETDHTEFVVKPDAVDLVEQLVWCHDQPFGDSSAIPTFLLAELTRKHVTVALCGDGGDELFAGYERFAGALALRHFRRLPGPIRRGVTAAASLIPAGKRRGRAANVRRFLDRSDLDTDDAMMAWVSFVPEEWRDELTGGRPRTPLWALSDYHQTWLKSKDAPLLHRLLDLNLRTYLLDDLLPKADRMSMAHALEVRSPFLDRELVEFARQLPSKHLVRGMSGKRVLKRAVQDLLPEEVLSRRKQGFGGPLDRWFRQDLAPYVTATLGAPSASVRSHLDGDALDRLLSEHQEGRANRGLALWALLTLEVFLRREGW